MKLAEDMRRWIGAALKWVFPIEATEDSLSAIQQAAIERNRLASEENCAAAHRAAVAITELLSSMEGRRNGSD